MNRLVGKSSVRRSEVGIRVDGDCRDSHRAAGTHHSKGDLTAIGNQNRFE